MRLFWQKRALPTTSTEPPAPKLEVVRRVEIIIEREWTTFLIRRRTAESKPEEDEILETES